MVCVDVKQHDSNMIEVVVSELRSCVKVEVDVLTDKSEPVWPSGKALGW